jgi:hypothetical protein
MANTFARITPLLFQAMQEISRELSGGLRSVFTSFSPQQALADKLTIPIAPKSTGSTYTPSMTTAAGTDSVDDGVDIYLGTPAQNPGGNDQATWHLTGEQERSLENAGMLIEWQRQMIAQKIRYLVNLIEAGVCQAAKEGASRAYGTAGTTPFATTIADLANVLKILKDNGAPESDLSLVINTTAGLNLRSLANLVQAYQAGTDEVQRQGTLLDLYGFKIRESAGISLHTKGTGTSYVTSGSTAVDTQSIALVTGSGTVVKGDVVTFAADTANKYVIDTGVTAPGTIKLGRPGARVVIPTANAMTIGNNYTPNFACHKNAIMAAVRPPQLGERNANIKQTVVGDGKSGLSFLFCEVAGDGMTTWRLHALWGAKAIQEEHIVLLMG